jgi:hypothetical protein
VEVAPEASPLLLAGADQPLARLLEVICEPDGVGSYLRLAGEILKQAPVGRGEVLPSGARGENKLSYGLVAVGERQAQRRVLYR